MNLTRVPLDPRIHRLLVLSGQPKQPVAAAVPFLAVGEVEEPA